VPHHVTQRGNGRARTFFSADDYALYLALLAKHCEAARVGIWAWVLMPNHVHLILTPRDADGLRRALSKVHRACAGHVHARQQRTGHFWQGRFGCVAMDEAHLGAALRYVALNPVRARLVKRATDWRWSSVHAQLGAGERPPVTDTAPVRARYPDFAALIAEGQEADMSEALRQAETVGRPLGDARFLTCIERLTGRTLKPGKRGPKLRDES
jgi:putative transposase